ncbi:MULTISPECIES: glycosyltransferase family 2 protein [Pedobacter]|uniref:glycosyltransferase family 2 protein n=1 Tax=Pedobacter TaxID=84567 RepID=UPI00210F1BDA|nr:MULTISPECIES: glycosyltransferase [unclassified Pedobacter]
MEAINVVSLIGLVLSLLYFALIALFTRGWLALKYFIPVVKAPRTRVSVIVAARNEAAVIERTIKALLEQTYEKSLTEIIFIDDHSTDATPDIIRRYEGQGVVLIQLNETERLNSYKKKAIQTAIGQARGDLIVTTDADCVMGVNWLSTIIAYYEAGDYKMISCPVAYFEERTFFERAQSLEFLYLIGMGASTIGNGMPSTCNGANLAYQRRAFYEVGGFSGIDNLASGDDELLLHKMAAKYPDSIGFLKSREAIVYTHAKPDLEAFIQQRKRWASKSTRYQNKIIIALGIGVWLFNLSMLISIVAAMFDPRYLSTAGVQLLVKICAELIFLYGVTAFAGRRSLLQLLPVLSVLHILYIVYIGIAGNSGKYNWKGRMVR